jgi:hypothetical protein
MERSFLTAPAAGGSVADVAAAVCGIHAQIPTAAELSLGRRLGGATRDDVQRALWDERSLVKTFGPRGTVHLLATADLPMWTGALGGIPSGVPQHPEGVRFTPEQGDEVIAAIGDALRDAELTVDELTAAIRDRTGPWAVEATMDAFAVKWPRWRQLTSTAAHRGVLCFGPNRGRNVTYTNPTRWLPGFAPAPAEDALRGLLDGFLRAYGPATPAQFARWLAIPVGFATRLFSDAAAASLLEPVEFEGEPAWVAAGDTSTPSERPSGVRLLPYFDAFVVASHPRGRLYPDAAAERALANGQAGNVPVVLVDGQVGGVWHQRRSARKLDITVEPLRALSAAQRRSLDEDVGLVGAVMQAEPRLAIGRVTVGPHA